MVSLLCTARLPIQLAICRRNSVSVEARHFSMSGRYHLNGNIYISQPGILWSFVRCSPLSVRKDPSYHCYFRLVMWRGCRARGTPVANKIVPQSINSCFLLEVDGRCWKRVRPLHTLSDCRLLAELILFFVVPFAPSTSTHVSSSNFLTFVSGTTVSGPTIRSRYCWLLSWHECGTHYKGITCSLYCFALHSKASNVSLLITTWKNHSQAPSVTPASACEQVTSLYHIS